MFVEEVESFMFVLCHLPVDFELVEVFDVLLIIDAALSQKFATIEFGSLTCR